MISIFKTGDAGLPGSEGQPGFNGQPGSKGEQNFDKSQESFYRVITLKEPIL